MTMTETKVSDEEIEKLIERNESRIAMLRGAGGMCPLTADNAAALRQLQAENKALKEDKRLLNDTIRIMLTAQQEKDDG